MSYFRPQASERRWPRALAALGLSLALNLVLGAALLSWLFQKTPPQPRPQAVALRGLSAQAFERNRAVKATSAASRAQAQQATPARKPTPPPEELPRGQVVAVPQGNGQRPQESRYLSEFDNATRQPQTRARETTAFYKNPAAATTRPPEPQRESTGEGGNGGQGLDTSQKPEVFRRSKPTLRIPRQAEQAKVAMRPSAASTETAVPNRQELESVAGNADELNVQPGESAEGSQVSSGRLGKMGELSFMPSQGILDRVVGAAAPDDLGDLPEGDQTILNTRAFKYASFFNRVKQSVAQHWNPNGRMRARDPSGQIFSGRDRHTLVSVTLDETGRLLDVFVERSSGLDFLDLEAVQAFERAQPFPNPPAAMLGEKNRLSFRFGFTLSSAAAPFRLFQ